MRAGLVAAGLFCVLASFALFVIVLNRPSLPRSAVPIPLSTRILGEAVTPVPTQPPRKRAASHAARATPVPRHIAVSPRARATHRATAALASSTPAAVVSDMPAAQTVATNVETRGEATSTPASTNASPASESTASAAATPAAAPVTATVHRRHRRHAQPEATTAAAESGLAVKQTPFPFPIVANETPDLSESGSYAAAQAELDAAARYVQSVIERDESELTLVRVTARRGPHGTIEAVAAFRNGGSESYEHFVLGRARDGFTVVSRVRSGTP